MVLFVGGTLAETDCYSCYSCHFCTSVTPVTADPCYTCSLVARDRRSWDASASSFVIWPCAPLSCASIACGADGGVKRILEIDGVID